MCTKEEEDGRVGPIRITAGRRAFLVQAGAALLGPVVGLVNAHADPLMTYPLRIKGKTLRVELADSPETRRIGLMNRRSLGEDHGMLFVFDTPGPQAMWMKNTLVPLSVAFVRADGIIANIEDMAPQTEDAHASDGPVLYAIETNRGWFARHRIRAGDRVEGLKSLRR